MTHLGDPRVPRVLPSWPGPRRLPRQRLFVRRHRLHEVLQTRLLVGDEVPRLPSRRHFLLDSLQMRARVPLLGGRRRPLLLLLLMMMRLWLLLLLMVVVRDGGCLRLAADRYHLRLHEAVAAAPVRLPHRHSSRR